MLPRISGTRAIITYFQKTSFYDPIFGSAAQLTSINPHKMLGFLFGIMGNPTPKSHMKTIVAAYIGAVAQGDVLKLASFDGAKGQTFKWSDVNDPVMGGQSASSFAVDEKQNLGIFNGTCAIVPKLSAPGFANIQTKHSFLESPTFKDASSMIEGGMQIRLRTTTPEFKGFRLAFSAKDVPRTSIFGGGSFKAGFQPTKNNEFEEVFIPFNQFSYDWSPFTGNCGGKDPNGQQHYCCSSDTSPTSGPKYCPTASFLSKITDLEVWAEGSEGDFHLEIDYIGAASEAPASLLSADGAIKLASFDGSKGLTYNWKDQNDPVMGGQSTSSFETKDKLGVFNGTCAIVPSLKAPGFCKVTTSHSLFKSLKFHDASSMIDGGIQLRVRSTTPEFKGFRFAFASKDVPKTSLFGGSSFKAGFEVTKNSEFETVFIPFSKFSYDWSGFTGDCGGKDPNGQQHYCCSKDATPTSGPKYCPTSTFLSEITDLELWAEGAEGDFHLEVDYIAAGPAPASAQ